MRGQKEIGAGGFHHYQVCLRTDKVSRMPQVKLLVASAECHVELSRSVAAVAYVWKEDTRVPDTQFELGHLRGPGNPTDWTATLICAKEGRFDDVDPAVLIRYSSSLMRIHSHYARPTRRVFEHCRVFVGPTGTGKTHRALEEAESFGPVYFKSSTNKWWDGYHGEENVVMDEFDGQIGIVHLLKWLDKYPVAVEIKGGSTPLRAVRFWITSNIQPEDWYQVAQSQVRALQRRIAVSQLLQPYVAPIVIE